MEKLHSKLDIRQCHWANIHSRTHFTGQLFQHLQLLGKPSFLQLSIPTVSCTQKLLISKATTQHPLPYSCPSRMAFYFIVPLPLLQLTRFGIIIFLSFIAPSANTVLINVFVQNYTPKMRHLGSLASDLPNLKSHCYIPPPHFLF